LPAAAAVSAAVMMVVPTATRVQVAFKSTAKGGQVAFGGGMLQSMKQSGHFRIITGGLQQTIIKGDVFDLRLDADAAGLFNRIWGC